MTPEAAEHLRDSMQAHGITPPSTFIADGKVKRHDDPSRKRGNAHLWVVVIDNGDGTYGGSFGNHAMNARYTWFFSPRRTCTPAERAEYGRQIAEARKRQEEERHRRQAEARQKAADLWRRARPARPDHPYLVRKSIRPHGIRQLDNSLVIPIRDPAHALHSLQFIGPDGLKRYLSGGAIIGHYHAIGPRPGPVLAIAEGYATAATICEATGYPVAVAFTCGNLRPVALALRAVHPGCQILVCADDDHATPGNPGATAARQAADAVDGIVILPDFTTTPEDTTP